MDWGLPPEISPIGEKLTIRSPDFTIVFPYQFRYGHMKGKQMNDFMKAITAAFKADIKANCKIIEAAEGVAKVFPRLADITPKIEANIRAAIAKALPAAASAAYSADKKTAKEFTEEKKSERAKAQRYVSNSFKDLIRIAYPANDAPVEGEGSKGEGEASDKVTVDPKADKWAKRLSDMIEQVQKAEGVEKVDIAGFVAALKTARTFVTLA